MKAMLNAIIKALSARPELASFLLAQVIEALKANPDLILEVVPDHYQAVAKAHAPEIVDMLALNVAYLEQHPALLADLLKAYQS